MLDTVVITMSEGQFDITDYERFSPSAKGLFEHPYYRLGARANFACYQNPTKTDMQTGKYKPRLTLIKRMRRGGFVISLRIEFSAPKLIFGNNFDELVETDFDSIMTRLLACLPEMGINTNYNMLADAEISAIHYSKNIPLTDYSNCGMIINELHKINLNKKLDLSGTDFRNNGHAIRYHANSFEVTFYDKIKDLQQAKTSEKRAIEKDNFMQEDLFKNMNLPKQFDVLRMEVRLGNRLKIKQVLEKLGIVPIMTFSRLYDASIAQKVLNHYWQSIWDDLKIPLMASDNIEDLYTQIASAKKQKPAKILQLVATITIVQKIGIRGLRVLMEGSINDRTWQRMHKDLKDLKLDNQAKFSAFKNIGKYIDTFTPLKLADYEI